MKGIKKIILRNAELLTNNQMKFILGGSGDSLLCTQAEIKSGRIGKCVAWPNGYVGQTGAGGMVCSTTECEARKAVGQSGTVFCNEDIVSGSYTAAHYCPNI